MGEVYSKSVLALMAETTRGTAVAVSGATDYTALQDDVDLVPGFEEIDNLELSASIGKSKTILGIERPTMSFSHYLRASGVVATAPDYNLLLKGLFGSEAIAAAEYNTVAGSSAGTSAARGIVNVDTGEGASYARGEALLIQDPNGYSVRNIYSISSDALTLGFNLATAPGVGVELGRSVFYSPGAADSDYISLSAWKYTGNGAAIQLLSGARPVSMALALESGQPINASFSLEGLEYSFNPIVISAANNKIDITDDGGTIAVTLTNDTYKDPNELAAHITTVAGAALLASGGDDFLCTYSSSTGKFTLATTTGSVLSFLWKTGTSGSDNTDAHVGTTLGFSDAADDTGSLSYTSDSALSWASPYTPTLDSENPAIAKGIEVMWGDYDEYVCKAASSVNINITNSVADVGSICATSGRSDTVFTNREVTVDAELLLTRHEVDTFTRFREGTEVPFACTWGDRKSVV